MRRIVVFLALMLTAAAVQADGGKTAEAAKKPKPRVVLVSVDGLRADLAQEMPFFKGMKKDGAWTFKAKAPTLPITVVSHAAMFTGQPPKKNGVSKFEPSSDKLADWRPLKVPTIFEAARDKGLKTAGFTQKRKLDSLMPVEALDAHSYSFKTSSDVVDWYCAALEADAGGYDLVFLHFADLDAAGHSHGWMSDEQKQAAEGVDLRLDEVVECLDQDDERSGRVTLLIVTSDHGGHDKTHGKDVDTDRLIPWIARGTGVAASFELSGVTLVDTAAVVSDTLGLGMKDLAGRVPDGLPAP